MKMHLTRIALTAACVLGSSVAWAQEAKTTEKPVDNAPTVDTIHLRNGGLYRGHVTEIVPGDHVTILVEAQTEPKVIPWGEVDRVIVATTPVPPSASGATPTHPIPPATPDQKIPFSGPTARVHVTSPSTVILYRHPAGTTSWVKACTSPCDIELPLNDMYRVTGNNVSQSADFALHGSPGGTANVDVSPQSTAGIVFGGLIGGAGLLTGYIGLLVTLVGLGGGADDDCCTSDSDKKSMVRGGLIAMGVGALLTVGGTLMFVASAKTDATAGPAGGSREPNDAWRKDPMWRTASEKTGLPAGEFPILFSHSF